MTALRAVELRQLVAVFCGYAVSVALYDRLPAHLDAPSFIPMRPFTAFTLPTAAALTMVLMNVLWAKDFIRTADEGAAAACRAIGFRVTMFAMTIHVLAIVNLVGVDWLRPWAPRIVVVLFGAVLIGVGNVLPLTRPNLVVGWRTRMTLAHRHVWIRVHRVAGSTMVGVGAALVFSGLLLSRPFVAPIINAAAVIGVVVLVVSYHRQARLRG